MDHQVAITSIPTPTPPNSCTGCLIVRQGCSVMMKGFAFLKPIRIFKSSETLNSVRML